MDGVEEVEKYSVDDVSVPTALAYSSIAMLNVEC